MSDLAVSPALLQPAAPPAVVPARMRETAQQFEAAFLAQMMRPMFEGLKTDGLFGGGEGEATWRSFLIDEMAEQTVKSGGIGLADQVVSQMLKMQEQAR
jgi:Rod binding domain-containing protein